MSSFVRAGDPGDVAAVAALHSERIGEGFLVILGPRFLTRLYRRIARSATAVLLVAQADDRVVGFVAATTSTSRLYAEFLRRDAIPAGVAAAPRILRDPRRVWETLRYGTSDHDDLPPAEILSIAVASGATGEGIGSALLDAALIELTQLGVEAVRVVTTVGNEAAIGMYQRAGFSRRRRTEVHHGVEQEVLVWP